MDKTFPRGIEVVTGALIRNAKGEIFLAKSPKWRDHWVFPGGHVDVGESIIDAAAREVKEETGLTVKYITQLHSGELITTEKFHRPIHMVFFTILFQTDQSTPILDGKELTEYCWVQPLDALNLPLAELNETTIKKYIEYIHKEKIS